MKIWDNGIIREMTLKETREVKKTEDILTEFKTEEPESIIEEFINRLANAESLAEVKEIAKDIKGRI